MRISGIIGIAAIATGAVLATGASANAEEGISFQPVHTTIGTAVDIASSGTDELWVAEVDANGALLLEHLDGEEWSTIDLGVTTDADSVVGISASASDDVWVATTSEIVHWTGTAEHYPAPANDFDGYTPTIAGLADVPGADAYIGVNTGVFSGSSPVQSYIYRFDGSSWVRQPGASSSQYSSRITGLAASGSTVYVSDRTSTPGGSNESFSRLDGTAFTGLAGAGTSNAGTGSVANTWVAGGTPEVVVLGYHYNGGGTSNSTWCASGGYGGAAWTNCAAPAFEPSASTLLPDGSFLIGGRDNATFGPAGFALHTTDDQITPVSGDPGDATLAIAADSSAKTAWALTQTGSVTTIQQAALGTQAPKEKEPKGGNAPKDDSPKNDTPKGKEPQHNDDPKGDSPKRKDSKHHDSKDKDTKDHDSKDHDSKHGSPKGKDAKHK